MIGATVITVRAETDLAARIFSAAVDAAWQKLPSLPLVVVDDCSPNPLMRALLETWDKAAGITVIRMGPPVAQGFYARVGLTPGETCSFGHAPSLDRGLWYVGRHLKLPWALVLDGDVILLADNIEKQVLSASALLGEQVAVIGEWVGTPWAWEHRHAADAVWHHEGNSKIEKAQEPVQAAIRAYGYVNMMCSLVNLETFWDPYVQSLQNTGWVANQWYYAQMARGRQSLYWPFFRSGAAVHIGAVAVATTQGETFGNIQGGRRYGQRDEGNYYAGYLQVRDLAEFATALAHRQQQLAPTLFVAPDPATPQHSEKYLRYEKPPDLPLFFDQRLAFQWMTREAQTLARVEVILEGANCFIKSVEGASQDDELAAYEEVFEHIPAMQRTKVYTPHPVAYRIGTKRETHDSEAGNHVFYWRYFSRGLPQWRWAEHYGWGRSLLGPLEAPTR